MQRVMSALMVVALSTGCATYAAYAHDYSDGPERETMGILVGVEAAVGVGTAVVFSIQNRREGEWYENAMFGFLAPFVIDVAFALGITASGLVGE